MKTLIKVSRFFFFKTQKEKLFILKSLRRGKVFPLLLYILYRLRLTSQILVVRKFYKIKLSYSPYALWLYFHRNAVRKEEEFVHFLLDEGNIFVDAGAHLGTVSLTASQGVGAFGKVIAIEPHPKTFSYLKENISLAFYKNISLVSAGVGERNEISFLSSSYVSDMNYIGEVGIKVKVMTLETICASLKKISLLKIDVEGYELQALLGLGKSLQKVEAILFESSPSSFTRYNYTLSDIVKFLEKSGFTVYRFLGALPDEIVPITASHQTKTRYEDLIAFNGFGKIHFQKKGGKILPS